MRRVAIIIGKLIYLGSRFLRTGGGQAAPGYYGLKTYPRLLESWEKQLPPAIVITGTNGKTTTARMVAHVLHKRGLRVLHNQTGSNLERGIISAILGNCSWVGNVDKFDVAVWEVDEAVAGKLIGKLNTKVMGFLNLYRDQMDRYGEINSLVKKWQKAIEENRQIKVLINGDDGSLRKLMRPGIKCFGVEGYKIVGERIEKETEIEKFNYEAKDVYVDPAGKSEFFLEDKKIELGMPGLYQVYNLVAATGLCAEMGIAAGPQDWIDFRPAFGRMEQIVLKNGAKVWLMLIKNPKGADQVIKVVRDKIGDGRLLVALNDNFADGTDVSWIWDTNWEWLNGCHGQIVVSGRRAYDMALRLKYAGLETGKITVESRLEKAWKMVQDKTDGEVFVLPTYTAMLEMQSLLARKKIKSHYWVNGS